MFERAQRYLENAENCRCRAEEVTDPMLKEFFCNAPNNGVDWHVRSRNWNEVEAFKMPQAHVVGCRDSTLFLPVRMLDLPAAIYRMDQNAIA